MRLSRTYLMQSTPRPDALTRVDRRRYDAGCESADLWHYGRPASFLAEAVGACIPGRDQMFAHSAQICGGIIPTAMSRPKTLQATQKASTDSSVANTPIIPTSQ